MKNRYKDTWWGVGGIITHLCMELVELGHVLYREAKMVDVSTGHMPLKLMVGLDLKLLPQLQDLLANAQELFLPLVLWGTQEDKEPWRRQWDGKG